MSYLPWPENITGMTGLFQYNDKITCLNRTTSEAIAGCSQGGGVFGIALLVGIFFFFFLATKEYRSEESFTVASFFTMMSSYVFFILQIVPELSVIITTIMFAVSIFFLRR